jgi:hypothetical protein
MSKKVSLNIGDKNRPNLLFLFRNYIIRKLEEDKKKWSDYRRKHPCPSYLGFDGYTDEEYYEEMEALRSYYGRENMVDYCYYDDDDDDYIVTSDGVIIFPEDDNKKKNKGSEDTYNGLRPGEYHRSAKDMDEYWDKMSKFNSKGKHKHRKHKTKVIDIEKPYSVQYIGNNDGENDFESHIIYFYEDYKDKYNKIEFNNIFEFDKYCEEMGFAVPPYVGEMISYCNISHCCLNPIAKDRGVLEVMREETYGDMYYEACELSYNYD